MRSMKKLTAIMAIALSLIIGGVYATWTYSTGGINAQSGQMFGIELSAKVEDSNTAMGTITIDSAAQILIDDEDGDHVAALVGHETDNEFVITFTPNARAADSDIEEVGIPMKLSLYFKLGGDGNKVYESDSEYNGQKVLAVSSETFYSPTLTAQEIAAGTTVKTATDTNQIGTYAKVAGDEPKFTWTITADEIIELLTLNGGNDLVLDSADDYNAFQTAIMQNGTLGLSLEVSEVTE